MALQEAWASLILSGEHMPECPIWRQPLPIAISAKDLRTRLDQISARARSQERLALETEFHKHDCPHCFRQNETVSGDQWRDDLLSLNVCER
jgi:hypothetical protein